VGSNPTLSAILNFLDKYVIFRLCYVLLRYLGDLNEARIGGFVAGLVIYQRLKEPRGNSHVWRYRRIQEARGVRTASIQGPFYIRPTQTNGAQPWVALDAATFDQAKLERFATLFLPIVALPQTARKPSAPLQSQQQTDKGPSLADTNAWIADKLFHFAGYSATAKRTDAQGQPVH
jgi:hypothetical protein